MYLCNAKKKTYMIFYFSGTGNSRWAAEYIANAANDKTTDIAEILRNPEKLPLEVSNETQIGFVFPVHGWMPPKIVRQFIKCIKVLNQSKCYIYCLMTCGDNIGEAMSLFRKDLKKAGLHLDSAFSLIMPESYVCLPGFDVDTPEDTKWKLSKAKHDIEIISEYVIHKRQGADLLTKGPVPFLLTYALGMPFTKFLVNDKPFTVDAGKCIKCGKCAQVCPVNNVIGGSGQTPSWKRNGSCTDCLACYHNCPQHAINHRTTNKKGQYICPLKVED